jgi:hypothetical protein
MDVPPRAVCAVPARRLGAGWPARAAGLPPAGVASGSAAWHRSAMPATRSQPPPEAALYGPVKALLSSQGYEVKGEVNGCDVVAVRGDEPPVIVELKRAFGLALVLQGIDRLAVSDAVYVAVGAWPPRIDGVRRLLRRVGLGLIVVAHGRADVVLDPLPYRPRRDRHRAARLLLEHERRVGDPNIGGTTRRPIVTAYRQEAERCLRHLAAGPSSLRALRAAGDVPNAPSILRRDVYGWFERAERGVYRLTPRGMAALAALGAGGGGAPPTTPHGGTGRP